MKLGKVTIKNNQSWIMIWSERNYVCVHIHGEIETVEQVSNTSIEVKLKEKKEE